MPDTVQSGVMHDVREPVRRGICESLLVHPIYDGILDPLRYRQHLTDDSDLLLHRLVRIVVQVAPGSVGGHRYHEDLAHTLVAFAQMPYMSLRGTECYRHRLLDILLRLLERYGRYHHLNELKSEYQLLAVIFVSRVMTVCRVIENNNAS